MNSQPKQLTGFATRAVDSLILLWGWKALAVSFLAGGVSALSMAPYHVFPVPFLTFPVLVVLLDGAVSESEGSLVRRLWPAFKTGWAFGFGYFGFSLWWIGSAFLVDAGEFAWLLPFAVTGLPALLAIFWGLATALARIFWVPGWGRVLSLAVGFGLAEWLRGTILTGFPWNAIGYAAMPATVTMQTSSLVGLYAMNMLAVFVFASPALLVRSRTASRSAANLVLALAVALMAGHVGYGFLRLQDATSNFVSGVRLRIVQPAIDQGDKWKAGNEGVVFNNYIELSNANTSPQTSSLQGVTHLIWPESAFPFILTKQRDAMAAIADLLPPETTLITGAMRTEEPTAGGLPGYTFNSLYVINAEGEIEAARDKVQLVPFGEYLPFQDLLESAGFEQLTRLRGGFTAGNRRRIVELQNAPAFLPLICYEIIFPGGVNTGSTRPGWMVNLTNDAWFGSLAGPYQHAHQARVRAVEEGLPLIRAANSGISFVTDGYGRIVRVLGLGQRGVIDARLPEAAPPTYYSQTGNRIFWIMVCIGLCLLVVLRFTNTNRLH